MGKDWLEREAAQHSGELARVLKGDARTARKKGKKR